jgi:para-nitrobenzyl esterase
MVVAFATLIGGSFLVDAQNGSATDAGERVTIETRLGRITGTQDNGAVHFQGVRYGQAPTAERRFMPPLAAKRWSGTYDATSMGSRCPQPPGGLGADTSETDEDCLFLNIATPAADGGARPVLFWIHGGSFTEGTANDYDGTILAAQGNVVVVTINYRLGLLGFADLSSLGKDFAGSASNGLRDQILALEWVRDTIFSFGGDPENVTIFGESAGGHSVHSLLAAPAADGLYHKAIAHSPGTANLPSQDQVAAISARLGAEGEELIAKLQSLPVDEILQMQQTVQPSGGRIDGTVVTRATNEAILARGANGVPLIAGTNLDEGTLFTALLPQMIWELVGRGVATSITSGADPGPYLKALEAAYPEDTDKRHNERIWTDMFRHSAIGSSQRATDAGPGGWLYRFDLPATEPFNGQEVGATHAAEIGFTFNIFASGAAPLGLYDAQDPVVRDLALRWSNTIIAFAKTGDPNGAGLPHWPKYSRSNRQTLVLDAEPRVEKDLDRDQRKLWESVAATP